MTAQFAHWTDRDIVDRFLEGRDFGWIARRTGKSVMEVKRIVAPIPREEDSSK